MIAISVALAGVAGFLFFRRPPNRATLRRLAPVVDQSGRHQVTVRRRVGLAVVLVGSVIGFPVLLGLIFGSRGAGLSLPIMIITGTILLLARRSARRHRALRNRRAVAHACSVLAAQLRIGQVPITALRSVAQDCPIFRPAVATADLGGDVTARWLQQAEEPGQAGLADLARAWRLAERSGAGMAEALDDVAASLTDDEDLNLVINSDAAGPRASGRMMAMFPLAGIGLGYLVGGDPIRFLFADVYGFACLTGGALLACAGVIWMERVADRAAVED